jgi:hypothetical protein
MRDRIHRHLDGELPPSDLSGQERREAEELRLATTDALAPLFREEAPDLTASVMAALRPTPAPAPATRSSVLRDIVLWFWRPRSLTLEIRPAWALPLLAVVALLMTQPVRAPTGGTPIQTGGTVMAASMVDGRVLVTFRLDAPGVGSVRLAGDFTGWEAGPALEQVSPGVWSTEVPLEPGLHDYAFLVDGIRWVQDPLAEHVADGFGGSNSRVAVLPPGGRNET